ncbi:MAG: septum formation initiator [Deltaproteobacteria bacterium CG_4_8_14_3_um_filter_51_11]|nr:septum formation initiator family protein [bacterium]OIP40101.1 MAG: hypothetical protein AUK25_08575 [Desulfobacteraceae bacterium CG2_30_51_40]PIP45734.1 MAG: septum formation initiator [Deltaproteobacteria bacterium CG23_combo_of_CG06-09_8_20_14_all_51_20]PIW00999.1 MAG: septum formation initiator [Deltaproteobacteria bacterium CG17_big_fil_post_rev_8_21_14_2_50_51_6]PIX18380.1 MAG: septum formation initiator [Deltaproteobacteria bacterium CG_4_8_14_3_um_filter_51_11]PIY27383.1 MAG: sept
MKHLKKISPSVLIMILIIIITGVWLGLNDNGFLSLYRERNERELYLEKISTLEKENRALISEIKLLRDDLQYVESVARRELNMLKQNEVLFKFARKEASN